MTGLASRVTIATMPRHLLLLALTIQPAMAQDDQPPPAPTPEPAEPVVATPPTPEKQTWIGVLSVLGSRKIPLLGKVDFQTDTHVLARAVKRDDAHWDVEQTTCWVEFPKTMGAEISVEPGAFAKLPKSNLTWTIAPDGSWSAGPWKSGWDASDHDEDGEPGLTLKVSVPFCGGKLYAASRATQSAKGRPTDELVVAGDVQVHVIQDTLGTKGPCLRLMAKDSDETMNGRIQMRAVPSETTCETAKDWPIVEW